MRRCLSLILLLIVGSACTTLPTVKHKTYSFPSQNAFIGDVKRPYEALGLVRSKVNYQTLDPAREEGELCVNYYHKAVRDLFATAQDRGADAVIDVKSVVFFEDGKHELFTTPECSDDGMEGQVLTQGIAVKWKPEPSKTDSK
jgi:hypothetical protein